MTQIPLSGQAFKRNPKASLRRLLNEGPVIKQAIPGLGSAWLVTHYKPCQRMLKDSETFATDGRLAGRKFPNGTWSPPSMRYLAEDSILMQDAAGHRRLRSLADAPFRRVNIEHLRPQIRKLADDLLSEMEAKQQFDLVKGLAKPLPKLVISQMLGLPDQDVEWFSRLITIRHTADFIGGAGLYFRMGDLTRYLKTQFELCRSAPRAGLLSDLVNAGEGAERLTDEELIAMVLTLYTAGHETTTHLLSTALWTLFKHPDLKGAFRRDPEIRANAVSELLRFCFPVMSSSMRYCTRNIDFHGAQIKRGDLVLALVCSANRDPEVWERPNEIDFNRQPNRHLTLGTGPHICLGQFLTRAEAEIALEAVFERWPEVQASGALEAMPWISRFGVRGLKKLPVRIT